METKICEGKNGEFLVTFYQEGTALFSFHATTNGLEHLRSLIAKRLTGLPVVLWPS